MHLVDFSVYSVRPGTIAETPVAVMASTITQFFGRPASSTQANECLRAWYGQPARKSFDDDAIGAMEGELPANGEEHRG